MVVPFVVTPVDAPRVVRHCPRCGCDCPFVSSGGFRVNAQKRRLHVWLVRRCAVCESTWNQPVHERVTPEWLGLRLAAYQVDDPDAVHRAAFDEVALRRHGRVEPATFRVEAAPPAEPFVARVVLARPFVVRFDHVLSAGLGVSRTRLRALVEAGRVRADAPLERPVVDGAVAWVSPSPAAPSRPAPATR